MRNSFRTRISKLADQYNPKEVVQRELLLLTHFLAKLTVTKEARTSSTSEKWSNLNIFSHMSKLRKKISNCT